MTNEEYKQFCRLSEMIGGYVSADKKTKDFLLWFVETAKSNGIELDEELRAKHWSAINSDNQTKGLEKEQKITILKVRTGRDLFNQLSEQKQLNKIL